MPEWTSTAQAVQAFQARILAGTSDESAPPDMLRAELGDGMAQALAGDGLTTAFGHPPGAIGAPLPFGVVLWETGLTPVQSYNPTSTGDIYEEFGDGEMLEEGTLALIVAVSALSPDVVTLQTAAERWKIPLMFFVSQHPNLAGLVDTATWRGFTFETWQWGDTQYYCGVAHVRVTVATSTPVPV